MSQKKVWISFQGNCQANLTVTAALAMPTIVFGLGAGLDYADAVRAQNQLQNALDSAVLSAARGLSVAGSPTGSIHEAIQSEVARALTSVGKAEFAKSISGIRVSINNQPREITAGAEASVKLTFLSVFGLELSSVSASATARVVGKANTCILGMNATIAGTVQVDNQATIVARNCSVYSNSSNREAIKVNESGSIKAQVICSRGGIQGQGSAFDPAPVTDCPAVADPLAGRQPPTIGPCDYGGSGVPLSVYNSRSLTPGVYCGGLTISGTSEVDLAPGTYIFKDGPLRVVNAAKLRGKDVSFYFVGLYATLLFDKATTIELEGARSGNMSGILMMESLDQPTSGEHIILSDYARKLVGTIYFPRATLKIDAYRPVGDLSAYTALIVQRLHLFGRSRVVLNSDYGQTDVPVPSGIKGASQSITLIR